MPKITGSHKGLCQLKEVKMINMRKSFNQIQRIMKNMGKERNEIRKILNEIDSTLKQYDEGEEHLRLARAYYIEAMEKLENFQKS